MIQPTWKVLYYYVIMLLHSVHWLLICTALAANILQTSVLVYIHIYCITVCLLAAVTWLLMPLVYVRWITRRSWYVLLHMVWGIYGDLVRVPTHTCLLASLIVFVCVLPPLAAWQVVNQTVINLMPNLAMCVLILTTSCCWVDLSHFSSLQQLAESALALSHSVLKEGGVFLCKLWQGPLANGACILCFSWLWILMGFPHYFQCLEVGWKLTSALLRSAGYSQLDKAPLNFLFMLNNIIAPNFTSKTLLIPSHCFVESYLLCTHDLWVLPLSQCV